jgi:hypothetical protein
MLWSKLDGRSQLLLLAAAVAASVGSGCPVGDSDPPGHQDGGMVDRTDGLTDRYLGHDDPTGDWSGFVQDDAGPDGATDASGDAGLDGGTGDGGAGDGAADASGLRPEPHELAAAPGGPDELMPLARTLVVHIAPSALPDGRWRLQAVTNRQSSRLSYTWLATAGTLSSTTAGEIIWAPPPKAGRELIQVTVRDGNRALAVDAVRLRRR